MLDILEDTDHTRLPTPSLALGDDPDSPLTDQAAEQLGNERSATESSADLKSAEDSSVEEETPAGDDVEGEEVEEQEQEEDLTPGEEAWVVEKLHELQLEKPQYRKIELQKQLREVVKKVEDEYDAEYARKKASKVLPNIINFYVNQLKNKAVPIAVRKSCADALKEMALGKAGTQPAPPDPLKNVLLIADELADFDAP